MPSLASQRFPEMYAGGEAPAKLGAIDEDRNSKTPPYTYGWVISRVELYEAVTGEPCTWDGLLDHVCLAAESKLYTLWTENGYENNEYSPDIPSVRQISVKYAVIFMACNDSDAIIKSVMENKKYHAECRACFGDSKTMKLEPAWFRMGIREPPKGFFDTLTVGNVD